MVMLKGKQDADNAKDDDDAQERIMYEIQGTTARYHHHLDRRGWLTDGDNPNTSRLRL